MGIFEFIHDMHWYELPEKVQHQIRRCFLDTIGAAIGGRSTELSNIIHHFAASVYGGQGAHLWLDGREVSAVGAALANATTIDSLDIHDNFNPAKGHAGVAVIPAALATLEPNPKVTIFGQELLATMVVGYEIALRAGLALHATAADYHTSGAWNALGCAAVTARRLLLNEEETRHALGIAEYHGPRSQMMRCIDHPTMLKDGSGWGAMAGVSAAILAQSGFTGAPALTIESSDVETIWEDLGSRWYICEQDFKRYAVCHWAQPAIAGTLALMSMHRLSARQIDRIRVFTFHEATRLNCSRPRNTEEAQYSLPFPVAAAVIRDNLGPEELNGMALNDFRILSLADRIDLVEDDTCNAQFPNIQCARVQIETKDGTVFESDEVQAPWDVTNEPATDDEIREKFRLLASKNLSESRIADLEEVIWHCDELPDANDVMTLLIPPRDIDIMWEEAE